MIFKFLVNFVLKKDQRKESIYKELQKIEYITTDIQNDKEDQIEISIDLDNFPFEFKQQQLCPGFLNGFINEYLKNTLSSFVQNLNIIECKQIDIDNSIRDEVQIQQINVIKDEKQTTEKNISEKSFNYQLQEDQMPITLGQLKETLTINNQAILKDIKEMIHQQFIKVLIEKDSEIDHLKSQLRIQSVTQTRGHSSNLSVTQKQPPTSFIQPHSSISSKCKQLDQTIPNSQSNIPFHSSNRSVITSNVQSFLKNASHVKDTEKITKEKENSVSTNQTHQNNYFKNITKNIIRKQEENQAYQKNIFGSVSSAFGIGVRSPSYRDSNNQSNISLSKNNSTISMSNINLNSKIYVKKYK